MKDQKVRVRFAPSPTGPLHIGGVRTALYNYLLARKYKGDFILRIEDTDQTRFVPGAEEFIFESLRWLGIEPDESTIKGGPYAPYRQSERKDLYREYAAKLVNSGYAYYAFDTPEELEIARNQASSAGLQFQYNLETRGLMRNSVTLPGEEVSRLMDGGEPYVIRLKMPVNEEIRLKDEIRGWVEINSSTLDDKVLMKSDGMPTYHLANIVDDHLMKITHVIRGEEWLPSAPAHVLLYKYFGWIESMPSFAHLPLLLKPEGTGKLSKRDADKGGFPIFPISWKDAESGEVSKGFREYGYLSETTINFLALLGWNPGTEQELFTMDELIEAFSLDRVNKSGARFDIEKAKHFNQQYIRFKPVQDFIEDVKQKYRETGIEPDPAKLLLIMEELKERITFPDEYFTRSLYFFVRPAGFDRAAVIKKFRTEMAPAFDQLTDRLAKENDGLKAEAFREIISEIMERNSIKPGHVMQIIRIIVTGTTTGIDLMKTLELIGPAETALRLKSGISGLDI